MYDRIYFQVDEVKINKEVNNTNIEMAVFVAVLGISLQNTIWLFFYTHASTSKFIKILDL